MLTFGYRRVINLDTAIRLGCNRITKSIIELENSPETFKQLFMCEFIDDTNSVFGFNQLKPCIIDSVWKDYNPELDRPFGNKPVWIGYDPSRNRDGSAIVVIAPPTSVRGKFRVLEKHVLRDVLWKDQATFIKGLTKRFNVVYIGIDETGPGHAVCESVKEFFPQVHAINYGLQSKTNLVLKAQSVINSKRIHWDAVHSDIAQSFMMIRRAITKGGSNVTFVADRTKETGHADVAWAIMHALINEGLTNDGEQKKTSCYAFGSAVGESSDAPNSRLGSYICRAVGAHLRVCPHISEIMMGLKLYHQNTRDILKYVA